MNRKYRYFSKLLGREREEISEDFVKQLLKMRFEDVSPALAWLKCGQKVVVENVRLTAEAVA